MNQEKRPSRGREAQKSDHRPPRRQREERDRRDSERRDSQPRRQSTEAEADGIIEGRNAVMEALRAGVTLDKVYIAKGETDSTLRCLTAKARESGAMVVDADRRKLDAMSRTHSHQGVIALAAVREYADVDDILRAAEEKGELPLIVVCDELSDPHNLGAVIRTAECAGAHGVIIPKRRSAGLTAVVAKTSAGAVSYVPVTRVSNLTATLNDLKRKGVGSSAQRPTGRPPSIRRISRGRRPSSLAARASG